MNESNTEAVCREAFSFCMCILFQCPTFLYFAHCCSKQEFSGGKFQSLPQNVLFTALGSLAYTVQACVAHGTSVFFQCSLVQLKMVLTCS